MKDKYTCLIVDDDPMELDLTAMHLSKVTSLEVVAVCDSSLEASQILTSRDVDIVFSDINLPYLSGIALKKSLRNPPVFVYITSFASFAADSYDVDAVDFVTKPVTFERLLKAANKAVEYKMLKETVERQKDKAPVAPTLVNDDATPYFFIKENEGYTKLYIQDVLYIESMGDFSRIITLNGKWHTILVSLKSLEKQLSANSFLRVHKQYIVNLQHIEKIGAAEISMPNKQLVPLSLLYRQQLLDKLVNKNVLTRRL